MAAEKIPSGFPNQQDPIKRFHAAYSDCLATAHVSVEHTGTEGWQTLYAHHSEGIRKARRELAENLRRLAKDIEDYGSNEDNEKLFGEYKKMALAIRESDEAFKRLTVDPVRQPYYECEKCISEAINLARHDEEEAPMVNGGLLELMKEAVRSVQRVKWDTDTGRVMLVEKAA